MSISRHELIGIAELFEELGLNDIEEGETVQDIE